MSNYDAVVYGATGFTGQLVAQYLAAHPQRPKLALAGRSISKVKGVIDRLTGIDAARAGEIGVLEASAHDYASLQRLAASARVIINTVGPYSLLGGSDVVRAAAEAGIGYVDLAGESAYVSQIIEAYAARAQETGAVVVPSCGFDALPFDLTTFLAAQELMRSGHSAGHAICGYDVRGGVSGGTLASTVNKRNSPAQLYLDDAYMLCPQKGSSKPLNNVIKLPQFHKFGFPTLFSPHNTRIVFRSWWLLLGTKDAYGDSFAYDEGHAASSKLAAQISLCSMATFIWLIVHVTLFGNMIKRYVPQGTGPSLETQLNGHLDVRTLVTAHGSSDQAVATLQGKGDPGYYLTARFISEAALAIALDKTRLSPVAQRGGILTPATIGAAVIAERLSKYGKITIMTRRSS